MKYIKPFNHEDSLNESVIFDAIKFALDQVPHNIDSGTLLKGLEPYQAHFSRFLRHFPKYKKRLLRALGKDSLD